MRVGGGRSAERRLWRTGERFGNVATPYSESGSAAQYRPVPIGPPDLKLLSNFKFHIISTGPVLQSEIPNFKSKISMSALILQFEIPNLKSKISMSAAP
jgi:hypothetical protein